MKKRLTLLVVLMISIAFQNLYGQENKNDKSKIGLGVSLFDLTDIIYDYDHELANYITVTVDFKNNFRLEPGFGLIASKDYNEYSIGIGGFLKKSVSKFDILYGLRIGLSKNETKTITPTIGGEYYFIENFSIGSEVQLKGLQYGGEWVLLTNTSVIIRFYL